MQRRVFHSPGRQWTIVHSDRGPRYGPCQRWHEPALCTEFSGCQLPIPSSPPCRFSSQVPCPYRRTEYTLRRSTSLTVYAETGCGVSFPHNLLQELTEKFFPSLHMYYVWIYLYYVREELRTAPRVTCRRSVMQGVSLYPILGGPPKILPYMFSEVSFVHLQWYVRSTRSIMVPISDIFPFTDPGSTELSGVRSSPCLTLPSYCQRTWMIARRACEKIHHVISLGIPTCRANVSKFAIKSASMCSSGRVYEVTMDVSTLYLVAGFVICKDRRTLYPTAGRKREGVQFCRADAAWSRRSMCQSWHSPTG